MIEFDTRYRPGRRTFVHFLIKYCWLFILCGIGCFYLAFSLYAGSLQASAAQFLAAHPSWFIDTGMLAEWSLLVGLALFVIAFLRVSVQYRRYSFYVDEHAFHLDRGLIRVQEITIPYRQISDVRIEQPYHWRLLGLAQLDITITSSREAFRMKKKRDFLIPCIDKSLAKDLSHFLVKKASGIEDEDEDAEYDEQEDGEDFELEDETWRQNKKRAEGNLRRASW